MTAGGLSPASPERTVATVDVTLTPKLVNAVPSSSPSSNSEPQLAQLDFDGTRHPHRPRTLLDTCRAAELQLLNAQVGSPAYLMVVDYFAYLKLTTRQQRERTVQLRVLKLVARHVANGVVHGG